MGAVKLFLVHFEGATFYVEAEDFAGAVAAWRRHAVEALDADEEPESVACVHEDPVIR